MDILKPIKSVIESRISEIDSMDVVCCVNSESQGGFRVNSQLIRDIAAFGAGLDFDLYLNSAAEE